MTACATEPGATFQTRLEYRGNPNTAWTLLDSCAAITAPSASAAILITRKLEQDLGGLTTAEFQELTAVVILSAARAQPPSAFADTAGTEPSPAEFDPIEYGHTQTRATDDSLSDRLPRAVREIYDADPDAAG